MKDGWTEGAVPYRVRADWDGGSTFYGPYRTIGAAKAAVTREDKEWASWTQRHGKTITYTVQKMSGEWEEA